MAQNHIIKKQILDFELDPEVGSLTFQERIGAIFKSEIVPLIDAFCSEIDTGEMVLRIDKLEIDLGAVEERNLAADFTAQFSRLFPQKLAEAAASAAFYPYGDGAGPAAQTVTEATRDLELLKFFLQEGRLPWWVKQDELYDIPALLAIHIPGQPSPMKEFIERGAAAGNEALLSRLVVHADDTLLEKLLGLFRPQAYQEIYRLSQDAIAALKDCPLLASSLQSKIRPEVWVNMLLWVATPEMRPFQPESILGNLVGRISKISGVDNTSLAHDLLQTLQDKGYSLDESSLAPLSLNIKSFPTEGADRSISAKDRAAAARSSKGIKPPISTEDGVAGSQTTADRVAGSPETDQTGLPITPEFGDNEPGRRDVVKPGFLPEAPDGKTVEYFQQLNLIKSLSAELLAALSGERANQELPAHIRALADKLIQQLPRVIQAIASLIQALEELLAKTGSASIFTVQLPERDQRLEGQAEEFEADIRKLYHDLTALLAEHGPANQRELLKKIVSAIESVQAINQGALRAELLPQSGAFEVSEELYIRNSGLVLLWPYLPQFFDTLGLVSGGQFRDDLGNERAVLILQYLADGLGAAPEYELMLNKILCGLELERPMTLEFAITEAEAAECENLLQAVIQNWPVLKNVSVAGFRGMFLSREGIIRFREGHWVLQVANQAYDILIDQMPWGINTIKLPWMKDLLFVEWRL